MDRSVRPVQAPVPLNFDDELDGALLQQLRVFRAQIKAAKAVERAAKAALVLELFHEDRTKS